MKLIKKIAVVCSDPVQRSRIVRAIESRVDFEIIIFSNIDELLQYKYLNSLRGLVIGTGRFGGQHLDMLIHLNQQLGHIPLLMVAGFISNHFRLLFGLLQAQTCLILEEKYELIDINVLLERITRGENLIHREFCRYPVDVNIKVSQRNGSHFRARVLNLSMGGAQIKIPHVRLFQGQVIQVKFTNHPEIKCQISWVNKDRGVAGIKFLRVENNKHPIVVNL